MGHRKLNISIWVPSILVKPPKDHLLRRGNVSRSSCHSHRDDIHHVYFLVLLVQSHFDENGIEKFGFDEDEYNFNEELPSKPQPLPLPLQIEDGYDEDEHGLKGRINNRRNRRLERKNRRLDRRNRRLDRRNRRLGRTKRDLGDKSYHRQLLCNLICKKDND